MAKARSLKSKQTRGTRGKGGRPSLYKPEYAVMAKKIAKLGATDIELAEIFEVSESTIHEWKRVHPEFSQSLKAGKLVADAEVADKLFRRATGYSHKAVKIFADAKSGDEHIVTYTERYAPDTTACIFWLKNRQPQRWRDKQSIDHRVGNLAQMTDAELEAIANGTAPQS